MKITNSLSRRASIILSVAAFIFALVPNPRAFGDYSATVDANIPHQTMEGWGVSLCWWGKVIGGFPDASRNDYINKVFDPVLGLGLNVVRYNIGGGENPAYNYLTFRGSIPGFEPSSGTYDWTADANQRWVLQQAIAKGANVLEAFSNSPPYWMTISGSVTGAVDGGTNINSTLYGSAFADYLTEVVKHYHDIWGITFNTLEPFNEPDPSWWKFGDGQEGCHFDPGTQNTVAKLVGASLASKGLATKLSANDDNSINDTVNRVGSHYDATALSYVSQINTHSYNGDQRAQLATLASSNGKGLHMSEYGDKDGTGLSMSYTILSDLRDMQVTAWVYWQPVDNSAGWGFFLNPESSYTNTAYTINEKYYVMGNYSKFIHQGYKIVDINDASSLAAYSGSTGTMVIVTTSGSTQNVTYQFSNFGVAQWTATPYRTSSTQSLAKLTAFTVTGSAFTYQAPKSSVTTFVLGAIPYAPASVTGTGGNAAVTLSWSAATAATSYNVKRATVNGGPYTIVSSGSGTSFTDATVTNGTTYYYVVTAVGAGGESGLSSQTSVRPTAPVSPIEQRAPASQLSSDGKGGYNINFTAKASVVGHSYQLQWSPDLSVWQTTGSSQGGTGANLQFLMPVDASPHKFYRILIQP